MFCSLIGLLPTNNIIFVWLRWLSSSGSSAPLVRCIQYILASGRSKVKQEKGFIDICNKSITNDDVCRMNGKIRSSSEMKIRGGMIILSGQSYYISAILLMVGAYRYPPTGDLLC